MALTLMVSVGHLPTQAAASATNVCGAVNGNTTRTLANSGNSLAQINESITIIQLGNPLPQTTIDVRARRVYLPLVAR
jgi:hypothetical protein